MNFERITENFSKHWLHASPLGEADLTLAEEVLRGCLRAAYNEGFAAARREEREWLAGALV